MKQTPISEQIANNNQVEDYYATNKTVRPDFSGKILEMKYLARSESELNTLLSHKENIKTNIIEIKKDLKFGKVICRLFLRDYEPSITLQKSMVDFQQDIFDEITIPMIEDNLDDLKKIMEYSINKYKTPVSLLLDIKTETILLLQVFEYFKTITPKNIRWLYRKLSANIETYRIINKQLTNIPYYLVGCDKILGKEYEKLGNLDISTVCKIMFGFSGCSLDYSPAPVNNKTGKKRRFAPTTSVFDEKTYEWIETEDKEYRIARINNYVKQDKIDITQKAIDARPKLKILTEKLRVLPIERYI